ncbi:polysaccharide deacetylase family protein [Niallia sp. JL1B1071]|uniref:polysaccharide deacetylase family protein n=1 Tax=Niallia tiangongensis TaxID=3237105 RepID=UPI0037DD0DE9
MKSLKWSNFFIFLFCLSLLFLGFKFFEGEKKKAAEPPAKKPEVKIQYDKNYKTIEINSYVKDKKHGGYWTSYPILPDKTITTSLQQYITKKIIEYDQHIQKANVPKTQETSLHISYSITHYSKQTISILFETYEYITGTNGISKKESLTFDLQTHKQLTLKELFQENSHYLFILSKISYCELMKDNDIAADKALLKKGTAPIEENFQNFAVLNDSILFYFPENQVAAVELGVQELAIKKEILQDNLLPIYQDKEKNNNQLTETTPNKMATELPDVAKIDPSKKVIALTFDDGPSNKPTKKILNALKKNNGHATFFVLGERVQYYPEVIQQTIKEGHEIGNHSWDHPLLTKMTKKAALKEFQDTDELLKEITGIETTLIRPPYGAIQKDLKKELEKEIILWTIDPKDWKQSSKKKIVDKVIKESKDESIILMHDIYDKSADAAVELIEKLTKEGYQLVTISQLREVQEERKNK